ncbi:uncharacterized protein LOC108916494 [Anoplophora glabripennis]|nr:uncharacterized protein LOC108916494 [Anoplophora glabripennis]
MYLKLTLTINFLIGLSITAIKVDALKCYVCGDEEPDCKDFELTKDTYAKECLPPNDQGCFKETRGNIVIRKCASRKIDDCQKANGVEYCYCFTDLCNSNIRLIGPTDDEDLIEGSGITTISTGTENPLVLIKDKSNGSKASLYGSLVFIPFVALFYNK